MKQFEYVEIDVVSFRGSYLSASTTSGTGGSGDDPGGKQSSVASAVPPGEVVEPDV